MITLPSASLPWRSLLHSSVARETPSVNWWSKLYHFCEMVNLPCRELLLQLQQGVALGKGRSAPNASPSRDCPRRCTRDQSLDPLSPRPKGSEGWAVPTPCRVQRVGSFSVKGQDERSATALDCVPPWSLPVTWLDVKGQYADRPAVGQPFTSSLSRTLSLQGSSQRLLPSAHGNVGLGAKPRKRVKGQVPCRGLRGQTAPHPRRA